MKIKQIREIIRKEIFNIIDEAEDPERVKVDKQKQDFQKQKFDFDQKKFDFQKKQSDVDSREADKRETERNQDKQEKDTGGSKTGQKGQKVQAPKPNISFKTQGEFYTSALVGLKNLQLSDNNLLNDDEKHYIALAVQSAEGRFDKGFEKFLRKGKAGNIYGKDFSDEDIKKIIEFCKKNEFVR